MPRTVPGPQLVFKKYLLTEQDEEDVDEYRFTKRERHGQREEHGVLDSALSCTLNFLSLIPCPTIIKSYHTASKGTCVTHSPSFHTCYSFKS